MAKHNIPNKPGSTGLYVADHTISTLEIQIVKILDEYADRERRKANMIIHNYKGRHIGDKNSKKRTGKITGGSWKRCQHYI